MILKNLDNCKISCLFAVIIRRERSELSGEFRNIISLLFNLMYHFGFSTNDLPLKAKDDYKSMLQSGRSMIEMLGVLAIIAVLSVGGIAGYSKAMEKFKVNKTIAEYAYLFEGLIEHIDEFHALSKPNEGDIHHGVASAADSLNLIPKAWRVGNNSINVYDEHNNLLRIFSRNSHLVIDMYLGGFQVDEDGFSGSMNFSPKFCAELLSNVVLPLHSSLYYVFVTNMQDATYYGDNLCSSNRKCIRDITLSEIQKMCNSCGKKQRCGIIFEF